VSLRQRGTGANAMTTWDQRYAVGEYWYGVAPNEWLVSCARHIMPRGRVLSLGEGEGRNAVWLAAQGFAVQGVDGSPVAVAKAERLAAERGVGIEMRAADLAAFEPAVSAYDAVVLVFLHLPPTIRRQVHARAEAALTPGGLVILEAFTPAQLSLTSGGPRERDLLYEADLLRADFPGIDWDTLEVTTSELHEGRGHEGPASVVRGLGRRRAS
jgi:SAM-dependent methyltransferase